MYGKRELTALGAALLAALAVGAVSVSAASAAPTPAGTADTAQSAAQPTVAPRRPPQDDYWRGYRDGYRAAGQDCVSAYANSLRSMASPGMTRMSDYDRGWLDGYDDGYARFCRRPPR
ncbi:hypothetical protein [Streptosporangium sandarakinum]|uniref:Lectin-like protein BA14k n=1 Tax=Streptosporangium sandarakinum TaxID=1260955 RepID=A0A852V262_9ACTN|nr:hypothetical protein [Streptosporangium sandarakinum]NYF42116.1 hypothetical protein [Streptosporangium sandarakinum]